MIVILLYIACILIVHWVLQRQYTLTNAKAKIYTISWITIVLFSLIFVGVNYCYTYSPKIEMSYDRGFYQIGYNNDESPSIGLLSVFFIAKILNLDFNQLALLITVFTVPLVFIAYKYAKGATPLTIVLFLLTPYIINGFDNFKQTFTNGFSCILFALLTRKQNFIITVLSVVLIILSCMFHPSGFILILFYIIFRLDIKTDNIVIVFITLFSIALFLKPILLQLASLVANIVPSLSDKIFQYFSEDSQQKDGRIIVALKGLVYFYITSQILLHKRSLSYKVNNFNYNIILCIFVCFLYLLSYYNVWMPRMAELFIFPVMLFWSNCIYFLPYKKQNIIITGLFTVFFTFRLLWLTVVSPPIT